MSARFDDIKKRIEEAKEKSPLNEHINIVAVVKNQNIDAINSLITDGITDIAENRVQELKQKSPLLIDVKKHIIGHLQTNKARMAIEISDMIQSVDSERLLVELERQAEKMQKKIPVLIQINIANEAAKFGASKEELPKLLKIASEFNYVSVKGLMAIMPIETKLLYYQQMYEIFIDNRQKIMHNIDMKFLSMGMSNDFEQALSCGANMIRLGRCLFD